MKSKLLMLSLVASLFGNTLSAQTDDLGYKNVEATLGQSYKNRVFFGFENNNLVTQLAEIWDIAFYRNNPMDFGTRINDGALINVYQVSANPSDFDTVDLSQKTSWGEPLYNPDKTERLQDGAFESSDLLKGPGIHVGWGTYNTVSHKVEGKVVFVLEYPNGDNYKLLLTEYTAGYTFKYAKWNGSSWDATITKTIANGNDDKFFNYFSFKTGEKVENAEPNKNDWDIALTRYWTFYNEIMMYTLSGVIQSPNIQVARVEPEAQNTNTFTAPESSKYSKKITTIGDNWKKLSGFSTVLVPNVVYYIKKNNKYYRMYFTKVGGSSTGDMHFKYKDITATLGVTDLGKKASFGIYPNPVIDKKATILFDVKEKANNTGSVEIYDLSGKKVYESSLSNQSGLYKKELNLSQLSTGNYIVKITFAGVIETKKIIVK